MLITIYGHLNIHCCQKTTIVTFDRLFGLCGQESSLLWTPALRPLYRSDAPSQGDEGNR